jgi:hypothetical protein
LGKESFEFDGRAKIAALQIGETLTVMPKETMGGRRDLAEPQRAIAPVREATLATTPLWNDVGGYGARFGHDGRTALYQV